jgi:hypothetical protein
LGIQGIQPCLAAVAHFASDGFASDTYWHLAVLLVLRFEAVVAEQLHLFVMRRLLLDPSFALRLTNELIDNGSHICEHSFCLSPPYSAITIPQKLVDIKLYESSS